MRKRNGYVMIFKSKCGYGTGTDYFKFGIRVRNPYPYPYSGVCYLPISYSIGSSFQTIFFLLDGKKYNVNFMLLDSRAKKLNAEKLVPLYLNDSISH